MKSCIRFLLLLLPLAGWTQSSLPPCPADTRVHWHKCFGTRTVFSPTFPSGSTFGRGFDNLPAFLRATPLFQGVGASTNYKPVTYVGEFWENETFGRGVLTFSNGEKYVGNFSVSGPNGEGILYSPEGVVLKQGSWNEGTFWRTHSLDTHRFPFDSTVNATGPQRNDAVDSGATERERLLSEFEAERKRRQEVEAQLAAAQSTAQPTPPAGATNIRSAHALVIGNSAYPGSARLDNPVNDVDCSR